MKKEKPKKNNAGSAEKAGRVYRYQRMPYFDFLPVRTFNPTKEQVNFLRAVYTNVSERLKKRIQQVEPGVPISNFMKLLTNSLQRIEQLRAHAAVPVKEFNIGEIELFGIAAERVALDFPIPPFIQLANAAHFEVLNGIKESAQIDADGNHNGLWYWYPYNMHNSGNKLLDLWFEESFSANDEARFYDEFTWNIFKESYIEALGGYVEEFSKYTRKTPEKEA